MPSSARAEGWVWENVPGGRMARLPAVPASPPGFHRVEETGITFTNTPPPGRMQERQVRLNGCGVAAGDVDGDGLCDLFFCSLEGRSHLYKNLGNLKFREITEQAGLSCQGLYTSGATFADIDGNGTLDLLVNTYGNGSRLFLNDGQGHFLEKTNSGLARRYGSTSLTLADIDGNGTLDLYVANYITLSLADYPNAKVTVRNQNGKTVVVSIDGRSLENNPDLQSLFAVEVKNGKLVQLGEPDVLYLNQGGGFFLAQPWNGGRFLDQTGLPLTAPPLDYGLSVMFRDLDGDGLPDLYVCNDLFTPDRVWINDGMGRFRAASNQAIRHTSMFSMGVDFADINRDGIDDFVVVDMLSRSHSQRMTDTVGLEVEPLHAPGDHDNRPQFSQNTLFIGRGDGTYAETAALAGVEASEWTWAPIFLDVDLDGYEDLLVTTGHFHDALNADMTDEFERQKASQKLTGRAAQELLSRIFPRLNRPRVAFHNRGDLTFDDVSERWHFNDVAVSQGMCLADLDNDGDLDVIINNFDAPPTVYRNEAAAPRVAVRLKGLAPNTSGVGSKITFLGGPVTQSQQMICGGRFLSGDDFERVFAAGSGNGPFSIEVAWRNGKHSLLTNVQANCLYEIDEAQARVEPPVARPAPHPAFREVSELLKHVHRETAFDDFERQPLLPHKLTQAGPALAWVDVNGDGREDLLIGGGRGGAAALFLNDGHGQFASASLPGAFSALTNEQGGVVGFPTSQGATLLLAQSSLESKASAAVQRINYSSAGAALGDSLPATASCPGPLALADVDGDGQLDLFVGGRVLPGQYPAPAASRLFKGTAAGRLVEDHELEALLKQAGLVNGAVFSDLDGDGWPDLILAVEWGSLRVFHNDQGHFHEVTHDLGLDKFTGWWNGVVAGDFDGDGRMDLAASNWGRNSRYERYRTQPLKVYYGHWNSPDSNDLLEAGWDADSGKYVPLRGFDAVRQALPWIQERYTLYRAYGEAGIADVLGSRLAAAAHQEAATLESMVFLNRGDHFEAQALPTEAQFSPSFGIAVADLDGDGQEDLFLGQNFYGVPAEVTRYDAGRGLWLRGDGQGHFSAVSGQESGVIIYGEQRGVALCDYDGDGRVDLAVGVTGEATRLFHNERARPGLRVILAGPEGNRAGIGAMLRLVYAQGSGPAREVRGGGGYWSQDSTVQVLGMREAPISLWVRWPGGKTLTYPLPPGAREVLVDPAGKIIAK